MNLWRNAVRLDQMPDKKPATLKRLSDEDLNIFASGWRPGTADFFAANREVRRRDGRPTLMVGWLALAIAIGSLAVSLMK